MNTTLFLSFVVLFCLFNSIVCDDRRLIAFNETFRQWLTQEEIEPLFAKKIKFMDLTDAPDMPLSSNSGGNNIPDIPTQPMQKIYVQSLLPSLSATSIASSITSLSNFFTRYYTSVTGKDAAEWIFATFNQLKGSRDDITVQYFNHAWLQPSVIVRIPGRGPNSNEVVIIGAHEDSVGSSSTARSPGADDDASGTATIIEAFRVLASSGYVPDRTVEFHTYAAEEAGLRGSQDIANSYLAQGVEVMSMMQFDMTGYGPNSGGGPLGIIQDFTNPNLTSFLRILVDSYSTLTWSNSNCGYACSDHGSWTRAGYRAAFPFEAPFGSHSPFIHSQNDVLGTLNMARCLEFSKIAVGYVVELAGIGL